MYTNDERFVILHTPGSNTWTLQIKFVQRRDHGMYECQVGQRPSVCLSCSAHRISPSLLSVIINRVQMQLQQEIQTDPTLPLPPYPRNIDTSIEIGSICSLQSIDLLCSRWVVCQTRIGRHSQSIKCKLFETQFKHWVGLFGKVQVSYSN